MTGVDTDFGLDMSAKRVVLACSSKNKFTADDFLVADVHGEPVLCQSKQIHLATYREKKTIGRCTICLRMQTHNLAQTLLVVNFKH